MEVFKKFYDFSSELCGKVYALLLHVVLSFLDPDDISSFILQRVTLQEVVRPLRLPDSLQATVAHAPSYQQKVKVEGISSSCTSMLALVYIF
jgi:hypothetical protein